MDDEYTDITYAVAERIARITLNRPDKRNALDLKIRAELVHALKRAEADDDVSVVLIDGAGEGFCSGYDMMSWNSPKGGWISKQYYDDWTDQFARSCLRDWLVIWELLKPVVCMVHGFALAGGTEIMSMCDISFVADARIGYPPMRAQTTPDTLYFPWKVPMSKAKYLQLTGNSVTGKEAADMGWVTKSFPADRLLEETMRELRPITTIAPDMVAANKLALNQAYEIMGFRTALSMSPQWHALAGKLRPNAGKFRAVINEQGLKAAIEWRDGAFKSAGFP